MRAEAWLPAHPEMFEEAREKAARLVTVNQRAGARREDGNRPAPALTMTKGRTKSWLR
jgi:hypothetical protein